MCTTYWLVLGGVALFQDNSLKPPRHGLHEVLGILEVVHLQCPQLLDLLLELWQTGGFEVLELVLHPVPDILDGVEVW